MIYTKMYTSIIKNQESLLKRFIISSTAIVVISILKPVKSPWKELIIGGLVFWTVRGGNINSNMAESLTKKMWGTDTFNQTKSPLASKNIVLSAAHKSPSFGIANNLLSIIDNDKIGVSSLDTTPHNL